MYSKKLVFKNIEFILQSDNLESLNKQISHISQFYTPYIGQEIMKENIKIHYLEDKKLYEEIIEECKYKKYILHQSFENQVHKEYQIDSNKKCFIIDNQDYICIKNEDNHYRIISDGREAAIKWPFRIIREILVRKKEENNALFMHGTAITINDRGILILGNHGSGKTTLATKLLETEENIGFLSNDRVFLEYSNMAQMEYFPIPVVYAMGTVKNSYNLDEYFKNTRILEKRTNKVYESSSVKDKVDVPLTDMPKIFKNVEMKPFSNIDMIVFSQLNYYNNEELAFHHLSTKEKEIKLHQTCFTIFDWESLRLEWIYKRKKNQSEVIENKINTIDQIVKNVPIIELDYGVNVDAKKLIKMIKE